MASETQNISAINLPKVSGRAMGMYPVVLLILGLGLSSCFLAPPAKLYSGPDLSNAEVAIISNGWEGKFYSVRKAGSVPLDLSSYQGPSSPGVKLLPGTYSITYGGWVYDDRRRETDIVGLKAGHVYKAKLDSCFFRSYPCISEVYIEDITTGEVVARHRY